ncbi:MAG: hypothetical protein ACOX7I_08540, partial [Oscillospiraceae bacterium]
MAIVKMKKLRLLAVRSQREELLKELMLLGCVEISDPQVLLEDQELSSLVKLETSELGRFRQEYESLESGLKILDRYAPVKSKLFSPRPEVSQDIFLDERNIEICLETVKKLEETDEQIRRVAAEKHRHESVVETLLPWQSMDIPLELAETESCSIILGTMPAYVKLDEVNEKLADLVGEAQLLKVSSDKLQHFMVLVCMKDMLNKAWEVLRQYDFATSSFQGMTGTVRENLASLRLKIKELASKKEELEAKIVAESGRRDEIKLCSDRVAARIAKAEAAERLLGTESVVALQGWIPASEEQKLAGVLSSFDCAWETQDPGADEIPDVPVKL